MLLKGLKPVILPASSVAGESGRADLTRTNNLVRVSLAKKVSFVKSPRHTPASPYRSSPCHPQGRQDVASRISDGCSPSSCLLVYGCSCDIPILAMKTRANPVCYLCTYVPPRDTMASRGVERRAYSRRSSVVFVSSINGG